MAALVAARGYLQCAPNTNLLILDDHKTVGGVWSKDNIYPGLRTNNHRGVPGTLEFPDSPFGDERGVGHFENIPGEAVHQYLADFAAKFGLLERMRYETTVVEAEKLSEKPNSGWKLLLKTPQGRSTITTDKLIIGTGLHNKPLPLSIKGQDSFDAYLLHAGQLGTEAPKVIADPDVERVSVYGGSKYSFDSVYKFAAAGKKIDWIISKSGHGPTVMIYNFTDIPFLGKVWAERLVTTRFVAWFSPCTFGGLDGSAWWRWLLHSTRIGRKVVSGYWSNVYNQALTEAGYLNHPNLKALLPDCEWFDVGTGLASLNYPTDILEFVRSGQVKVYREDISHLSDHTVNLKNGTTLRSDAFIASSGWEWRPTVTFKPDSLHASLGVASSEHTEEQKAFWSDMDNKADREIFSRFPILRSRPYPPRADEDVLAVAGKGDRVQHSPTRLYRLIAPPLLAANGDRSLAFAGQGANISHTIKSAITGIWIYAFFNDKLAIDPRRDLGEEKVAYESALLQRWSYRRHTYGFGQRFVDFVWDAIPWNDVLLKDLGMNPRRKKGSWFGVRYVRA